MKLSAKLSILHQMNAIYDEFISGYDLACDRQCASCCTRNVTMTTLEGHIIMKHLESSNRLDLLDNVKNHQDMFRYTPQITTNQMAQMGYEGKEIPEEDMGEVVERCPILENGECPVYEARPFGCRCMVSSRNCIETGYAETDPFIVTVNNVFLQFLEHIDEGGLFGNFTDVLLYLESRASENSVSDLLKNHPLGVLLIPPEHREKIRPILETIQSINVPKER